MLRTPLTEEGILKNKQRQKETVKISRTGWKREPGELELNTQRIKAKETEESASIQLKFVWLNSRKEIKRWPRVKII